MEEGDLHEKPQPAKADDDDLLGLCTDEAPAQDRLQTEFPR